MVTEKTMRAAFVRAPFEFKLAEIQRPRVREGWALVRVEACGICGTDLHIAGCTDHALTPRPPGEWQGFGHEIAGVVAELGAGISHVKEGDRVVLESGSPCHTCKLCRNGRSDLCNKGPNFWNNESMGFAEYVLAPRECLVPYQGVSPEVASLTEPLGVAMDMTYTAEINPGDEVLVLGLGPIGLFSIPLARMQGAARIYAANRSGGRRVEVARAYGADEILLTAEAPLESFVFRYGGVDRALVSASVSAVLQALPRMNYGGIVTYVGIEYGSGATLAFDANEFHFRKLQLRASHAAPALYFPRALQLLQDVHIDGETMISDVMPLEDIEAAMIRLRDTRAEVLKIVITP
jgi:L-iditol 2-dehydrogenase